MKTIKLFKGKKEWICKFIDDKEIMDLFGIDEISTPYLISMNSEYVKNEIQKRNIDCNIEIIN